MLTPRIVSWLRRVGIWSPLRGLHGELAPRVCALVHAVVTRLPTGFVGRDLALKHVYDYRPILVRPELIRHTMYVGNWRRGRSGAGSSSRWAELRRWRSHGGAWKSLKRHASRNVQGRFILDGKWDLKRSPFEIRPTIVELFVEGVPPERTTEYRRLAQWIEAGDLRNTKRSSSLQDVDRYFAKLREAYESIRRSGYRMQEQLGHTHGDEISVCVDRNGQLGVYGGGNHRLSIARILGLESVPVMVKRVHAAWVSECTDLYGGSVESAIARGLKALAAAPSGPETRKADTWGDAGC